MASTTMLEIERKYDVDHSTPLPELVGIPGVERVADPAPDRLEAVYFDTADLSLAARGITLRRRTGGTDHGWHLKLPAGSGQRQEIQSPLGQPETVPGELVDHILVYTRGKDVRPTARLTTQRTTHRLYGPGGEHLADFVDDQVHAEPLAPTGPGASWREWEIELVHGTVHLLEDAGESLSATGAAPSRHASKLERALGDALPPERLPRARTPRKKGPAADVFTAYLDAQINEILVHDPGVRGEVPDAVHQMRSATRRLRSALAVYRKILKKSEVGRIQDELKWLAGILGTARDAEVMRERLRDHIQELPDEFRTGPVPAPAEHELDTDYNTGYQKVLVVLKSGRYYRLLDDMEDFRDHPPAKPHDDRPAHKVTAKLVNRTAKRLDRAHRTAKRSKNGPNHDAALHQVRKDAKRLRHAAESVTDIHGKRALKLANSAQRIQKILGDHQDSVMARSFLHRLAADPDLPTTTVTIYRRLLDKEEGIAADTAAKYAKVRKKASGLRLSH